MRKPWAILVLAAAAWAGLAHAQPPATQPASYEKLLDSSVFVVTAKLAATAEDAGPGWHKATLDSAGGGIYSQDGIPPASFPLRFSDADAYKPGQEGVWFVEKTAQGFEAHGQRYRPIGEKEAVLKAAEPWLEQQIADHLQAVPTAYQKDPDGDRPETWKAMQRLVVLGLNEKTFPTFKDRTADHPACGHLADLYKALGADLGIVPYPKTPQERAAAAAAVARGLPPAEAQILKKPDDPKYDESLDFAIGFYLYHRFSIVQLTLGATDERFGFLKKDLEGKVPAGTKMTRMALFTFLLEKANSGAK